MRTVCCHHHGAGVQTQLCHADLGGVVGGAEYVMALRQTSFIIALTICVSSQKCPGTKVLCVIGLLPLRLIRLD